MVRGASRKRASFCLNHHRLALLPLFYRRAWVFRSGYEEEVRHMRKEVRHMENSAGSGHHHTASTAQRSEQGCAGACSSSKHQAGCAGQRAERHQLRAQGKEAAHTAVFKQMMTTQQQRAQQVFIGDHCDRLPATIAIPVSSSCAPVQYAVPVAPVVQQAINFWFAAQQPVWYAAQQPNSAWPAPISTQNIFAGSSTVSSQPVCEAERSAFGPQIAFAQAGGSSQSPSKNNILELRGGQLGGGLAAV